MAFGIEARVPFCTAEIADFAASLPSDKIVSNSGTTKAVLREAARGTLPDDILTRPKIGFLTNEPEWLRQAAPQLRSSMLTTEPTQMGPVNTGKARARINAALEGNAPISSDVWRLLVFTAWSKRFDVTFE